MNDYSTYMLLSPQFFVSLDRRMPGPEFRSLVEAIVPPGEWTVAARGVWTQVQPRSWKGAQQGWKLHVSATPANAAAVLERVVPVLVADPAAFKFASDPGILGLILSKNWPREGGGKFITVYPDDDAHFQRLGRALAAATEGLEGPYILSDRRVPGSKIVFYRYGEHRPVETVDPRGFRTHTIAAPSGESVSDRRTGYYKVPGWLDDPYGARSVTVLPSTEARLTLTERYEARGSLKYSNLGGLYYGFDLERQVPVAIRERRPLVGWVGETTDAVGLLANEAETLRRMDGTGWTPGYVDTFQVWEHHYLVMELVPGQLLRDFAVSRYFQPGRVGSPRRLFWTFRHLILQLVAGIEEFHRRGIILRDLSTGNVLVRPDRTLCFIDFEYSWCRDAGQDWPSHVETPGFASPGQMAGRAPTEADDFHSLGAVVVEMCSMLAPGLGLNPPGILAAAEMGMDEIGLPRGLLTIARGLLEADPALRWGAAEVRRALGEIRASDVPWTPSEPGRRYAPATLLRNGVEADAAAASEATCAFLEASASPQRSDCMWPSSPEVYRINPVCIRFGACGPIEHVRRSRGSCPDAWLDWVERQAVPERCPPGLHVGRSGVALTLAACGREAAARDLLRGAVKVPLLPAHPGLYDGAAGVGLAALAVGTAQGDGELTGAAVRIGDELERLAERRPRGIAWRGADGTVPCGLGDGGSGIALFYTCLGACTGDGRYWRLARQALEFEISQVKWGAGYAFWPLFGATRRANFRSPHVIFGSAGVGAALLRLLVCTGDPELRTWAERCAHTLTFRWTNKLWQDMGLAGWGETLLDMHAVTGQDVYRDHALRVAEALLPTQVRTPFGTTFPGGGLARVTSDFGMGASGIALFLHRLVYGGHRAFFADHLLPGFPASAPAAAMATAGAAVLATHEVRGLGSASAPGTRDAAAARRPAGRAPGRARARTLA